MWLSIIGPGGSGKNVIADIMVKEGYEDGRVPLADDKDLFMRELKISQTRLQKQLYASTMMDRRDIITVRNYWDSHEIYIPIEREMLTISAYEENVFKVIYRSLMSDTRSLIPPHAVIYVTTTQMAASDRLKLKGMEADQDRVRKEIKMYEVFAERIRCPLITLDGTLSPETLKADMEFNMASLKVSNLQGSLWQREFFR